MCNPWQIAYKTCKAYNVTKHLPEGYELVVGTRTENVHIYYELAKVSLVANVRSIKLIVSVPPKTTNSYFDLYGIVILPQPIASNKHVRYSIDYTYFGIQHSKRDYMLFTENDHNLATEAVLPLAHLTFQFLVHKLKLAR